MVVDDFNCEFLRSCLWDYDKIKDVSDLFCIRSVAIVKHLVNVVSLFIKQSMKQSSKRLFIGLTGGIGSGKSTVSTFLADLGAFVVDADKISRALTAPHGLAIRAIRQQFGDTVIDENHALNREAMRALIFSNPDAKKALEQIIHPLVKEQMIKQALVAMDSPYVIFDIPLLIESIHRYRAWLSRICVVDCEYDTQVERVQQRSGLAKGVVENIIRQQANREERLSYADDVIFNGKEVSLDYLREQAYNFHEKWLKMSSP